MPKLSSRERIVMALNHKEPDLVPIDFGGSSNSVPAETAHKRLAEYLKLDNIKSEFQSIVTQCVYLDPRLMVSVYPFGSGTFILNNLLIRNNLGTHPAAERLFSNLLNYASRDQGKPIEKLPVVFDTKLKAIGYK